MTMKQEVLLGFWVAACACFTGFAEERLVPSGCDPSVMSDRYWQLWNADVQERIDAEIERNRKADGLFELDGVPTGTEVRVEQISHEFLFGAHSFKVNRTGRHDVNERYVRVFGELFNAATVPVHWNRIEMQPGCVRWKTEWTDTEEFFNTHDHATCMRYSPCAPLEQTIDFFRSRGVRMVAHPLVWGSVEWVWPHWVYNQYCPPEEKRFLNLPIQDVATRTPGEKHCPHEWLKRYRARWAEILATCSAEEIGAACPVYCRNLKMLQDRRIRELAERIGDRIDEWVVVNESSDDWHGDGETGESVCMSREYGLMPGDYTFRAFKTAGEAFPKNVKFILNDYRMNEKFSRQIATMKAKGLRLDKIGVQMHIFSDESMRKLVAGEPIAQRIVPEDVWTSFGQISALGVPLFLSEITIPSLGNSKSGLQQQAIAAYHLYRIWFSLPTMTGITWWHTLDLGSNGGGCESAQSGIFTSDGVRKPVYAALDQLINREWRTRTVVRAERRGNASVVKFRGFCGDYRLSWTDAEGRQRTKVVRLVSPSDRPSSDATATRLMVNADNDHYFRRRGPEMMTREAMVAYIDDIAQGGKVTDFVMCTMGQRASYDSKACEPIWLGEGEPGADLWVSNARLCQERGLDVYRIWIGRCREKGIVPWVSMRMNDVHGVTGKDWFRTCGFWRNHPELRRHPERDPLKGGGGWLNFTLDYAHKEVRDYHLAIFKELVDRYDADGYELDWMRWPCCFRPGREKEDAHFLTEFMRECRAYADATAARRGHAIRIGVRVPQKLVCAEGFGLDPLQWAKEGLVDLIVPTCFIQAYDYELDFAGWAKAVAAVNPKTEVIPGGANMFSASDYDGTVPFDLAAWRGWCDNMFVRGAKGVYLFNADYLEPEIRSEVYRNGIDPLRAAALPRRLLSSFDDITSVEGTLGQRCPFSSREGKSVVISGGTAKTAGEVAVVLAMSEKGEPPRVELNGFKALAAPTRLADCAPYCAKVAKDAWRWSFPLAAFKAGANEIAVFPNAAASASSMTVWCEIALK